METLCPVTRERLSFFAGKYKVLAGDLILSCHQFSPVFHAGCQVFREW
jgi:hypothetical protein